MSLSRASVWSARHLAIALGLSSALLLPAWDALLSLPPGARSAAGLLWLLAGSGVLGLLVLVLQRDCSSPWLRWLIRVPVGLLLAWLAADCLAYFFVHWREMLALSAGGHYRLWRNGLAAGVGLALLALLVFTVKRGWAALATRALDLAALFAPLPLVLTASYVFGIDAVDAVADPSAQRPATRMTVLLIFDELDAELLQGHAQALPNFQRLRARSLLASRMFPPANYTSESLPAILTGQVFEEASYSRRDVHMRPTGSRDWVALSKQSTLFADALGRGDRIRLIGWHLPYCSFASQIADCWDDASFKAPGAEVDLPTWLLGHSRSVAWFQGQALRAHDHSLHEYSRGFLNLASNYRLHRIGRIFEQQKARLLDGLRSGRHELLYAHLTCPHAPSLQAKEVGRLDMPSSYLANLLECDRFLGDVLDSLEAGPAQRETTLVLSSDHWFRWLDWQLLGRPGTAPPGRRPVPFFLTQYGGRAEAQPMELFEPVTHSRALRALLAAAAQPGFDRSDARRLLQSQGDGPTALRPF